MMLAATTGALPQKISKRFREDEVKNPLNDVWAAGRPVLNGWLSIGSPFTAEIMASQGFDSLTIDGQHGALDYSALLPMLQALRGRGPVVFARVPWRDPTWVMKFLDAGALGIICPMVNSRAQAEEFVSYMRYPPLGQRSYGPTRAAYAYPSYGTTANEAVLAFAMIETAEAMHNLDEIAATPGLDGLYVGPADLSIGISNGRLAPGFDRREPEVMDAQKRIAEAARANGIHAALHCGSAEYAAEALGWGYDMVTVGGDSRFLAEAAGATVTRFRTLTDTGRAGTASEGY